MLNPGKLRKTLASLKISAIALLACLTGFVTNAAEITNATAEAYSGGVYCHAVFSDAADVLSLNLNQSTDGSITGMIYTDDPSDPTLTLHHIINNSTGIGWSSYHVNIFMPNFFTIETAGPFAPVVTTPGGWTASVVSPVFVGLGWQGQVNLFGGPAVAPGGTLDFAYSITFSNGLAFSFTEEVAPGLVPEPSSLSLGLLGLAALILRRNRKA
jgi:hypothetical protein